MSLPEDITAERARQVRASDTDRQTAERWLDAAAAEGRISSQELEDRVAHARQARTYGDLEPLVRDLPEALEPSAEPEPDVQTVPETLHISASLRSRHMHGPWTVPPRIVASAGRGSVWLDFSEAVIEHDEVSIDARPNWRNVYVLVPDGYSVTTEESVPGTSDIRNRSSPEPRAGTPRLHVVARPGLGSIVIRAPRRRPRPAWRRPAGRGPGSRGSAPPSEHGT